MSISPPKGKYPKKVIIVHDGTQEWEVEIPWACTQCGWDTRTPPIFQYFPDTGFSFHVWNRNCMCDQPEYHWDILEQARLYGQIISQGGKTYKGSNKGSYCTQCGIHCPFQDSEQYVCWNCTNYPHYRSTSDDDYE